MRGLSAFLVICYHLQFGTDFKLPFENYSQFFTRGYLWVDLFFILSGFIIKYSYAPNGNILDKTKIFKFYISRMARIYPLHIFCLLYLAIFTVLVAGLHFYLGKEMIDDRLTAPGLFSLLKEVLLIHAWGAQSEVHWNIPSWSISAEMAAYIIFPLFVLISKNKIGSLFLAMIPISFYFYVFRTTESLDIISGLSPIRCISGFILGMMACKYRIKINKISNLYLSIIQVVCTLCIYYGLSHKINDVFLIPSFLMLVVSTWSDRGVISNILSGPIFQYLGKTSYSIYLNHVCIIQILYYFWSRTLEKSGIFTAYQLRILWICLIISSTLIISHFTFKYVEQYFQKALNKKINAAWG